MEKPLRNPQRFGLETYSFSDGNALVVYIETDALGRILEHKADLPHHIPLIFLHAGGLTADGHLVAWGKPQSRLWALKVQGRPFASLSQRKAIPPVSGRTK